MDTAITSTTLRKKNLIRMSTKPFVRQTCKQNIPRD